MSFTIQTLNNISSVGLDRLPKDVYSVDPDAAEPDAIILRSFNMHDMELPASVRAVGRAGAGVNNIPVPALTERGIPVFNAPGANANAVKELVLSALLLTARNIVQAWSYVQGLTSTGKDLKKEVEAGKKQFKGTELPGKMLGVIGLGAIGVNVANSARNLGMSVLGYDPGITVDNAWRMNAGVSQALSVEEVLTRSDFVTLHVPLVDATQGLINASSLKLMRKGAVLLNFSRAEIVEEDAVLAALESGQLRYYVCDFPSGNLRGNDRVIALPHLGASTDAAEDNCAVMVAEQVRNYLEVGNIRNSVNFPDAYMQPSPDAHRIAIVNANVPNMVGQISSTLARYELNIADLLNKSREGIAYTLVDVDSEVSDDALAEIRDIKGVLGVRALGVTRT